MAISAQQQELIDLLRNELAELIGYDYGVLASGAVADKVDLLEEFAMHAENIGNAAELVGLHALQVCCKHSMVNFIELAKLGTLERPTSVLVENWATMLLGYLQYFGQDDQEILASTALLDFLTDSAWPIPMTSDLKSELEQQFQTADIQIEDSLSSYPEEITEAMISLEVSSDINPELLRGLLLELPQQVETFDRAIEQYLITEDQVQLRIAQRIAHTVKGAANVVGIQGMANLMHYVEDLLELSDKKGVPSKLGFVLQDASDCLATMSEFLAGLGAQPTDLHQVLQNVIQHIQQLAGDEFSAEDEDDGPEIEGEVDEDLFDMVLADHQLNVSTTDSTLSPTPVKVVTLHAKDELVIPILDRINEVGDSGAENKVTPITCEISVENVAGRDDKADKADIRQVAPIVAPLPEPKTAAGSEDEVVADMQLNISEQQAQELLRLTGEGQIGNTQILTRLDTVNQGIRNAAQYHQQLRQLALDLERLIEMQTALASATSTMDTAPDDLDPLELERYNELNSFASHLREVTTDAHESISHLENELKSLKDLMLGQRQLAFESQELLLQVRMLPVSVYASRFQRCVRQAARLTNKMVELQIEGEDVLADSRVMTLLVDPLMHLLRNAVDHGIESNGQIRTRLGKPVAGTIHLSFAKTGDTVVITCRDDGAGLDYDAIEAAARKKGLLAENVKLTITDLNSIILSPGFSTRATVSQTSGRGVGLDVVNDQIRQLKGSLSIESEADVGTSFTLMAPMSIISAHTLVVQCGDHRLSVISRALEQIVYLDSDRLTEKGSGYVYQIIGEDELLPVIQLDKLVLLDSFIRPERYSAIVVIRNHSGQRCGVMVEAIRASEEQIVKPLSRYTVKTPGVVGATILGDGRVSPVIDLHDLPGIHFSEASQDSWRNRFQQRLAHLQENQPKERPMVLVVDDSLSARRSLAQFVGDMGLEVLTAKDGFEAIQMIEQKRPAIILADLEMPRMNGLELTSHLRANPLTENIPIIMITSRATEKHRSMASKVGVNLYLNKPWTDEELLLSIQQQMAS